MPGKLHLLCAAAVGVVALALPASAEELRQKISATRVIDLTHPLYDAMAFWPGGVPFKKTRLVDYDQGYQLHKFEMGENTGTHVDAPSHFIKGNLPIDKLALRDIVVPAVVIDVKDQVAGNADYQLSGAVGVGIDTLSLDFGPSKDFAFHVAMLKANKYQIENMANLDALPATGATVIVAVLPIQEGSQAQARILALLP